MPSAGVFAPLFRERLRRWRRRRQQKARKEAQTPVFAPLNWVAAGDRSRAFPCQCEGRLLGPGPPETPLLLADRAVEGRTAGLGDPGDRPAAARPRADRAFAVVDRERVLEIAEGAVRLTVIAQSRAPRLDRLLEDLVDRMRQCDGGAGRTAASVGENVRGFRRIEPSAKKRLTDVNVAEFGDALLIEQSRLQRRPRRPRTASPDEPRRIPGPTARRRAAQSLGWASSASLRTRSMKPKRRGSL